MIQVATGNPLESSLKSALNSIGSLDWGLPEEEDVSWFGMSCAQILKDCYSSIIANTVPHSSPLAPVSMHTKNGNPDIDQDPDDDGENAHCVTSPAPHATLSPVAQMPLSADDLAPMHVDPESYNKNTPPPTPPGTQATSSPVAQMALASADDSAMHVDPGRDEIPPPEKPPAPRGSSRVEEPQAAAPPILDSGSNEMHTKNGNPDIDQDPNDGENAHGVTAPAPHTTLSPVAQMPLSADDLAPMHVDPDSYNENTPPPTPPATQATSSPVAQMGLASADDSAMRIDSGRDEIPTPAKPTAARRSSRLGERQAAAVSPATPSSRRQQSSHR